MTTVGAPLREASPTGASSAGWLRIAAPLAGLALIVAARWAAVTLGVNGLVVGAAFGGALVGLWLATRREVSTAREAASPDVRLAPTIGRGRLSPSLRTVAIGAGAGLGFGVVLVGIALAGRSMAGPVLPPGLGRPAAPFLPWALVTIVVATAEEGILRGVLLDRVRAVAGPAPAVVLTTVAFALMHVPVYGWHVVPLDLAVGLGLAGLRLSTRTIVAPALAHVVADLATWWL